MARTSGGALREALRDDDRAGAFEAFLEELSRPPVVAVLEDLQWADEATLDLVRFVARRLPGLAALVIVTYRDDVDQDHPLRLALGDLVPPTVARIHLDALSVEAVGELAAGTTWDPVALHATTGGNPFFVSEVLASGNGAVPSTVRDAVLGRAARLSAEARATLEAAAVLGNRTRHDVVVAVAESGPAALDDCVARGFLGDDAGELSFRHDLARLAIENAITPWRRRQLHARAVTVLADDPDVVRRAHHAIGADDGDAVLEIAPRAAARAPRSVRTGKRRRCWEGRCDTSTNLRPTPGRSCSRRGRGRATEVTGSSTRWRRGQRCSIVDGPSVIPSVWRVG